MKNIKKRRIIEIILFLSIVLVSLIVFRPAARALDEKLVYVRDNLIKMLEEEFEVKIAYASMSPYFFGRIKIRDVNIYNAATNEKIAHFSLLYLDYRLYSLIKKDFTSVLASLGIYDGIIDFNIEKNRNILEKFDLKDASDNKLEDQYNPKETAQKAPIDIAEIIEENLKRIKNIKPIKIDLKNIAVHYTNENLKTDFYTANGRFTLQTGKIDFYINSTLRYNNFVKTLLPAFSTNININGSFYPKDLSASSIINFSNIKVGNISIDKFSVFASYLNKIASVTTLQDVQPIDVRGSWNTAANSGNINIECKDLKPFMIASLSEKNPLLDQLKHSAFTGNLNVNFSSVGEFFWKTAFDVHLPGFRISDFPLEKSLLTFRAEGDTDLIKLQNFKFTNKDIDLYAKGSYKIKDVLPNFNLNISKFKLPSGNNAVMSLKVFSKENKIFANIPSIEIGQASLKDIQGILEKKKGKTDIYLSAKDPNGGFSIDGTWSHPENKGSAKGLGYLELHGAADSISIQNIYTAAASLTNFKIPAQGLVEEFIRPVQMTNEFYISSDFEHFSYNIIQMVLASNEKNGFYSLFSLKGNESSFDINNIDILFNNINFRGNINSAFENEGMIFDSLMTLNDISYKVSGLFSDKMINIYGDYGLNVNLLKKDQKIKGTMLVKELPIPFIDSLFSADTAFEYENKMDWELICNYAKLEYIEADITKADESLEFYAEGYVKPKEAFFHNVKAGIKNKQLEGSAAFNLIPFLDENLNQYAANISLLDKNKDESFIFNSLFSFSDKLYFDGTCKIAGISLDRFLKKQRQENKLDAEFIFLGNTDSISVKADLKKLSFNLNGKNLEARAAAFIDNNKMSIYESSLKWDIHSVDNIKLIVEPSEQRGSLEFLYTADLKSANKQQSLDTRALFSFNFTSTAGKKNTENQNILQTILNSTSHFNIDMKISDWLIAGKKGETDIKAMLVKEPNIIALYAGNNDEIYAFKTDDGIVSLHIDESFPLHLNIDGILTDTGINLAISNIGIDLAKIVDLIPNNNIIKFSGGHIRGDLTISGTKKDPLFFGSLKGEKIFCTSPNYSPDTYGPVEIPIEIDGTNLSIPYTIITGKIGSVWAEVNSEFIGWIPYYTTVNCGVLENTQGLLRTKNIAFHADGRAEGRVKIEISPELISLEGEAYFDKGFFSIPFADLQKQSEAAGGVQNNPAFYMNLNLRLGKKSEFRFPSTELPFLRALAYTEKDPFNLILDTGIGKFEMSGSAKIRTGEIFYIKRNFYIKEGNLKIVNNPFQQIEPIISVRAEIKDKMPDGQPLTISLTAKEQHLDIDRFRPIISTSPPIAMSDSETMTLMGQVALGDLGRSNILKETLLNASDILAKMRLFRKLEQQTRDFLHVDVLSMRSLFIQNVILENLFRTSKDKPLTIGNYFDNTSVYIGKYFGSAIYADAMLHLSYYDPLSTKKDIFRKPVYGNLLFQPEIGFEMNTPLFLLRWHISPSRPDTLFVSDTGLTISWKFSY